MVSASHNRVYRYGLLVAAVFLAYGNILDHGFVWDDIDIIVENPFLERLWNIPRFFFSEDRISTSTGYYRPLTYVSFALDRALWGVNPLGYNITNLVLHLLVVLLFYRVVAALFKRENLALAAALIFALHPIAGEAVNFHAGGRNTLLCAFFALLSLLCYLNSRSVAAVVCFTLAIFSKEFALLLPVIFLLYDRTLREEKPAWKVYLPYLGAALCYLTLRSLVVKANANLWQAAHIADNIWIVPQILITYLWHMVFPFTLKTLYDVSTVVSWTSFVSCSLLLMMLVVAGYAFRQCRELLFSIVMFLLFLLPVSNIFNLGAAMVADRYAYFALLGFSLALAKLLTLAEKKSVTLAVMIPLCAVFISLDVRQNGAWRDEIALYSRMVQDAPELSTGYQDLGVTYFNRHDFPNAERYLTLACGKRGLNGTMLEGIAALFVEMDKPEKAIAALEKRAARQPADPRTYYTLSRIHEAMGNLPLAQAARTEAETLEPGATVRMQQAVLAACRRGEELVVRGNPGRAQAFFEDALALDPYSLPALLDLGGAAAQRKDPVAAERYFRRATQVAPLDPAPHYNLAVLLDALGRRGEAREELRKTEQLRKLSAEQRGHAA